MTVRRIRLKYESASVDLLVWEDSRASVSNLHSKERNRGHATELMRRVVEQADEQGLSLILIVRRFGHPIGPDNHALCEFYRRFGFVVSDPAYPVVMIRDPSQAKHGL